MGVKLLVQYIREVLDIHMARVPNQLLPVDSDSGQEESGNEVEENDDDDGINEFSGAGAAGGYGAPLGAPGSGVLGTRKNRKR